MHSLRIHQRQRMRPPAQYVLQQVLCCILFSLPFALRASAFTADRPRPAAASFLHHRSPLLHDVSARHTQLFAWRPFSNNDAASAFGNFRNSQSYLSSQKDGEETTVSLVDEVNAMRVREIKDELKSLGIGTEDAFEKKELVDRLIKARRGEIKGANGKRASHTPSTSSSAPSSGGRGSGAEAEVPLIFYSLESFQSVDASNTAQSVYVRPSPGQFACIKAELPYCDRSLTLLVDTACTGLVLRPSSVKSLKIPTFKNTFGSMQAAGGTVGNTEVAQLESFKVGSLLTGAMPAAVQDIGALPSKIDGIVGLTFLKEFATVDLCFSTGKLLLYRRNLSPPALAKKRLVEVAKTQMKMTRLGIFTTQVTLDGRNPVTMLVDTGAASTILNWKGLEQMGLDRSSSEVGLTPHEIGAIGADNVALRLTHRYVCKVGFNLIDSGSASSLPGVQLSDGATVNIDIGSIPVLDNLASDGVGGILGADLLMRSDLVRINFKGSAEGRLTLFNPASPSPASEREERVEAPTPSPAAATSPASDEPIRRKKKKKKVRSD